MAAAGIDFSYKAGNFFFIIFDEVPSLFISVTLRTHH